MLNGHFDTPPGSPGAGDCGSCVGGLYMLMFQDVIAYNFELDFIATPSAASLLELARLTADSDWVPPKPVIFLFNGAEELFLLVRIS